MCIVQSDVQILSSNVTPAQAKLLNAITNAKFEVASNCQSSLLYLADIDVSKKTMVQRIL
jgi:hypothetical protein